MKKFTSVLLVFVMLFTLAPINITAEDGATSTFSDIKDTDYYAEAATELAKSDILSGYPDGSFGAEKSITRAEMAAIVCRMIDKEADSEKSKGKTDFDDVAGNHWASGYINIASKEGIINGYGNGKFEPESFVKVEEAIKMIVCALGFASNIEIDKNDWSKAYLDIAAEKGISGKIKGKKGEEATRGDIAVLSYSGMGAAKEEAKAESAAKGTPVPSIGEGTYTKSQKVTLSSKVDGATIYYTINGDTPTTKSKKYTKAITISKTTTLKAIAVKGGKTLGDVMSVLYTMDIKSSGGGGGGGGGSAFGGGSSSDGATNPTSYTVSFNLNCIDAVNAPSAQNVTSGSKATKPVNPERDGFLFLGWTTSVNGEELFDFNTSVNTNITLYAKWSAASKFYGAITGTYRGFNVQRGYVLYTIDEIYADEVLEQHSDITLGERTFKLADGIDPYKNFGVATVIYVCTNSEGKYEIVKMEANDIGKKATIDFRDIELSETNGSQIVYYPSSASIHTNKIKLAPDAKFFENYLSIPSMGNMINSIVQLYDIVGSYDVEITVIENNGDSLYDIVVANALRYDVVTEVDVTKNRLNDRTFDLGNKNAEITFIDSSGKKISLSDFKKGDVISIVGFENYTGLIWDEVVNYGRKTVTGMVDEISVDSVYINGKEYVNISGEELDLGDEGTFYLTQTGKIFRAELTPETGNLSEIYIEIQDIDEDVTNNYQIVYYPSATSTKTERYKLAANAKLFYNYSSISSISDIISKSKDNSGSNDIEIVLVENTGDSYVDMVVAYEYYYDIVDSVDVENSKITPTFLSSDFTFDFENEEIKTILVNSEGEEITLSNFKQGDVIAYISDNNSTNKDSYTQIEIINLGDNTVTGMIDEATADSIYIDGTEYINLSGDSLYLGDEGVFYLTKTGKIFYFKLNKIEKYGYILNAAFIDSGLTNAWKLKILTEDNEIVIYEVADGVKINGITYSQDNAPLEAYDNETTGNDYYDNVHTRAITYRISKGLLSEINTEDYSNYSYGYEEYYNKSSKSFDGKTLEDDAKVFWIDEWGEEDTTYVTGIDSIKDFDEAGRGVYDYCIFKNKDGKYDRIVITMVMCEAWGFQDGGWY